MITPASSSFTAAPPAAPARFRPGPSDPAASGDAFAPDQASGLQAALDRTPAVRPDVVARAAPLAVDLTYPPLEIINQVALLISKSQDLSNTPD